MLSNLTNLLYLKQYITYAVAYIAYGLFMVSLGPMIPFLAQKYGVQETQLSFLFTCRIFGAIGNFVALKYFQSRKVHPPTHKIMAISAILIIIFNLLLIHSSSFIFLSLCMVIASTNYLIVEILIDVSIIVFNENVQKLLLFISGCFGIGATLSPITIGYFGVETAYYIFCIVLGLTIPAFFLLPSPKITNQKEQELAPKSISKKTEIVLCVAYCLNLGIMITKLGWSSSYAVMKEVSTKEQATVYPFLYSIFNVIFKFIWLFVPFSSKSKFKWCLPLMCIVECISMLAAMSGYIKGSLYFNNISLGMIMCPINTLIFSLSKSYNIPLNDKQATDIAVAGVFGSVIMITICGQLMKRIHIDMYYYFVMFLLVILWALGSYVMDLLEKDSESKQSLQFELLQKISNSKTESK